MVLIAGCGGGDRPRLAHADGARLISLAHRIGHEAPCAQARDIRRLRARANALVNTGRVPPDLQEPLMSGVAALEEERPICLPPVTVATTPPPVPQPVAPPAYGHGHDHGDEHGHHGHGHGD